MEVFERIDGRLLMIFMVNLVFWCITVISQRMNPFAPRVRTARWFAFLLGSRTDQVMWRTATIQIGMLVYVVCYAAILWVCKVSDLLIPFILSSVVVLILQRIKLQRIKHHRER
jgi:hypothetical protein